MCLIIGCKQAGSKLLQCHCHFAVIIVFSIMLKFEFEVIYFIHIFSYMFPPPLHIPIVFLVI